MIVIKFIDLPIIILLVLIASCKPVKVPQANIEVKIGRFDSDSAYSFISRQVAFGKRYVGTDAHENCKNWLVVKLESFGFELELQNFTVTSYDATLLEATNIIGRYKSQVRERILLCAHYDTRHIADKDTTNKMEPIVGADDGGSGVGVILEIARQLALNPIPMGVDIIFFDAEDYGSNEPGNDYTWGLGSQYWSKNQHEIPYEVKYGILLDMVGAENATFPKEGFSMRSASDKVNSIWKLAKQIGRDGYFEDREVGFYTDDHRFIVENTKIPMIDIINIKKDGSFARHHHTHLDNMNIISKETLGAVGQVVLATIYSESNKVAF